MGNRLTFYGWPHSGGYLEQDFNTVRDMTLALEIFLAMTADEITDSNKDMVLFIESVADEE